MSIAMVVLLVLLALGQWLTIQAEQDVVHALIGSPRTGSVDIQYKGMAFSRNHILIARYDIVGIPDVSTARWHARPWAHVQLAP